MLLNVSTYMGHWPFRPLTTETVEGVAALAEKEGSTHIIIANVNGLFYQDCQKANEELYAQLQSYKGSVKIIPFAVINPTYICWERDLDICLNTFGFKGVELAPSYHHYAWDDPRVLSFYKMCGEKNIPVRINNSFENFRQRNLRDCQGEFAAEMPKLLSASKDTVTIITQAFPTSIKNLGTDFADHALYIDTGRIMAMTKGSFIKQLCGYPLSHFCYGSLLPFHYADVALTRLYYAPLSDEEKEGVMFGELAKRLGL